MALINDKGMRISFDCYDLIQELNKDILEFGEDRIVEVVTQIREGVKLYKDYWLPLPAGMEDEEEYPELADDEAIEEISMKDLLWHYQTENEL